MFSETIVEFDLGKLIYLRYCVLFQRLAVFCGENTQGSQSVETFEGNQQSQRVEGKTSLFSNHSLTVSFPLSRVRNTR